MSLLLSSAHKVLLVGDVAILVAVVPSATDVRIIDDGSYRRCSRFCGAKAMESQLAEHRPELLVLLPAARVVGEELLVG